MESLLQALELQPVPGGAPERADGEPTERFVASPPGEGFLFGGLTMAVGLRAAARTADAQFLPKSLHALFLRPGSWGPPLDVAVTRVNDSRSFAIRRVALTQDGRTIAELLTTLHRPEGGDDHQHAERPSAPPPASLATVTPRLPLPGIMEIRPVHPFEEPLSGETVHPYWARFDNVTAHDALLQCCAEAFVSDYLVIRTPFPKGSTRGSEFLSRTLSHTLWFHRPVGTDWLLVSADPLSVGDGRFTSRGTIHDEAGLLVASFVQEGILRPLEEP